MGQGVGAKPFVKWAGGKARLLPVLDMRLPEAVRTGRPVSYVEPFAGGGAMLFHLLRTYPNITVATINDKNPSLVGAYRAVRDNAAELVERLSLLQARSLEIPDEGGRHEMFLEMRGAFNSASDGTPDTERAAMLVFLNKTCFNGLYRVNSAGGFNVPFGRYPNPLICDRRTIMADSQLLQGVEITCGNFADTLAGVGPGTFVYLDPPYRPVSVTAAFTAYDRDGFGDRDQTRLREFCDRCALRGAWVMQSNSCGDFLESLYHGYTIERVSAASHQLRRLAARQGRRAAHPQLPP